MSNLLNEILAKGNSMGWKRIIFLVLLLSVCQLLADQRLRVAILPFDGENKEMTLRLETTFESRLTSLGRFQMVTRKEIEKLFDEQHLQLSGFVDEGTVVKLGEMAGAQYILTGRLNHSGGHWVTSKYEATVSGTIKMIDVSNGTVSFSTPLLDSEKEADKREKAEQEALDDLVEQMIVEVKKAFPAEMFRDGLRVLEKDGSWVTVSAGSNIGVEKGTIFRVEAGEKLIIDDYTGEILGQEHKSGGLIKIKEVYPKYSKGYIVSGRYAFGKDAELKEEPAQKINGLYGGLYLGGALLRLDTNGVFPQAKATDMAYSVGAFFGYDDFGQPLMGEASLAYCIISDKIWALNLELSGKFKIPLIPQFVKIYPLIGSGLMIFNQPLTDLAIEKEEIPSDYQDDSAYALQLFGRGGAGIELNPVWSVGISAELSYHKAFSTGLSWEVLDIESDDSDPLPVSEKYLRYKDADYSGFGLRIAAVYHF